MRTFRRTTPSAGSFCLSSVRGLRSCILQDLLCSQVAAGNTWSSVQPVSQSPGSVWPGGFNAGPLPPPSRRFICKVNKLDQRNQIAGRVDKFEFTGQPSSTHRHEVQEPGSLVPILPAEVKCTLPDMAGAQLPASAAVTAMAIMPGGAAPDALLTGHADGSVMQWDMLSKTSLTVRARTTRSTAVTDATIRAIACVRPQHLLLHPLAVARGG